MIEIDERDWVHVPNLGFVPWTIDLGDAYATAMLRDHRPNNGPLVFAWRPPFVRARRFRQCVAESHQAGERDYAACPYRIWARAWRAKRSAGWAELSPEPTRLQGRVSVVTWRATRWEQGDSGRWQLAAVRDFPLGDWSAAMHTARVWNALNLAGPRRQLKVNVQPLTQGNGGMGIDSTGWNGDTFMVPAIPEDIGFLDLGGRLYAVRDDSGDRLTIYRAGSTVGESWLATVYDRDGVMPILALRSSASGWDSAFQKLVLDQALDAYRQWRAAGRPVEGATYDREVIGS